MKKILLASHGRFALGLKDTLDFFLGKSDDVVAVCAYLNSTNDYLSELQSFVDDAQEGEAAIFTDIYGGSVNQQVTSMVIRSGKRIPIVTSMNIPIVLSVILESVKLTNEQIEKLLKECNPRIVELTKDDCDQKEGELDEFFE